MTSPALMEVLRKVKKKRSSGKRKLRLNSLPNDLIVELTAVIAASSATPLDDLKSLRTRMQVLRTRPRMARWDDGAKEASMRWWDKRRYLSLLRHCARCDNPLARFLVALAEVGMRRLERAVGDGCAMAEYFMGMVRFSEPATRAVGMELLEKVAGCSAESAATSGDPGVAACRKNVAGAVRETMMRRWAGAVGAGKAAPACGRGVGSCGEVAKDGSAEEEQRFCCRVCRWNHEYKKFLSCL